MNIIVRLPSFARLLVVWIVAVLLMVLLGLLHESTEAQFAFASAAIIPVFLVTWSGGFVHGAIAAGLAALMWMIGDLRSGQEFREVWIPYLNGVTRLATYCFIAYMTARVRTLLQREVKLSTHDALTGLLNRRAFLEAGEAEAMRAQRYAHPMAVVFLDLDNFKEINDRRGHAAGDAALIAVANALKKTQRVTDTVARLGGDEYAVILPEIDCDAAATAAHKIAAAIVTALTPFKPVTASLGVAWFATGKDEFAAMLKAADALMYEMKEDGKGGVRTRSFE